MIRLAFFPTNYCCRITIRVVYIVDQNIPPLFYDVMYRMPYLELQHVIKETRKQVRMETLYHCLLLTKQCFVSTCVQPGFVYGRVRVT